MAESIVIQVGQCGNQIGSRFWDLALREHASVNKLAIYDSALSTFFRNVNPKSSSTNIPVGDGHGRIQSLRARAVLIDMEEGVVHDILRGPLRDVFDHHQLITDVSGSGNNWAMGNRDYGKKYREQITNTVRRAAERCDSLGAFFIIHSMGGGTGSGVGTAVLKILKDEFPDVYRFVTAVFPSDRDDVVTSPYNSVLAMRELTQSADCVLPLENQSLLDICGKVNEGIGKSRAASAITGPNTAYAKDSWPFEKMNYIAANLLLNLTSSSRFEGALNVDMNEITMNLVPFPKLHYITAAMTPLYHLADISVPDRALDQMFQDAIDKNYQLIRSDPRHGMFLACGLIVRGRVQVSDMRRNVDKLRNQLNFVSWNKEGWKTGMCSVPPLNQQRSLLALMNNTVIRHTFSALSDRFTRQYKRRAHLHHYLKIQGMEEGDFDDALFSLSCLTENYAQLETRKALDVPRLRIAS